MVVRRRRSRSEAEELVREFEASGRKRQAFCAGRGVSVAALDKYRRQHARGSARSTGRLVAVEGMPVGVGELLASGYIQADETPVDVQTRDQRGKIIKHIFGNMAHRTAARSSISA